MGRMVSLLVTLLLFGTFASTRAGAEETPFKQVVTPVNQGFVLSVDLPQSAEWEQLPDFSDGFGILYLGRTTYKTDYKSEYAYINVSFYVQKDTITFDEYVQNIRTSDEMYPDSKTIYDQGIDDTFGKRTFFQTHSDKQCYVNGQTVACDRPQWMVYQSVLHGRVRVYATLSTKHPDDLEKLKPMLQRIAKTVRIIPESELDPAQTSKSYSSPTVTTSKRRGHYLQNQVTIVLPPGWTSQESEIRHATDRVEQGRLSIQVFPDRPAPGPSDPYEEMYVIVEGLKYSVLQKSDYLVKRDVYISQILTEPAKIETPSSVVLPDEGSGSFSYCLSKAKTKFSDGTDGMHISTYAGKTKKGRELKVRIYSGGGKMQVCNIIYVADPKTFDAAQDRIDGLVKSVKIVTYDPALLKLE